MNHKIRLMMIFALVTFSCKATLKIYNSLPDRVYYVIHGTASNGQTLAPLEPYTSAQLDLKTTDLEISIVQEVPQAGQEIPVHTITAPSCQTYVELKTHKTTKGDIRLIPPSTSTNKAAVGTTPISHHNIWLTQTTYKPTYIPQETAQIQSDTTTQQEQSATSSAEPTHQNNEPIAEQPKNSDAVSTKGEDIQTSCKDSQTGSTRQTPSAVSMSDVSMQGTESHP